jgi:hypothetical protein
LPTPVAELDPRPPVADAGSGQGWEPRPRVQPVGRAERNQSSANQRAHKQPKDSTGKNTSDPPEFLDAVR